MSMKRVTVDGKVLNERTARMLKRWEFNALQEFYVVQGSYNAGGVSASAGTHDGGGALDISVAGFSDLKEKKWVVKQGRLAGFAAYYRPPLPNVWGEHIHAIAIGDKELSSGAATQVSEYYDGQDALADHGPDPDPRVKPIRVWPNVKKKKVSGLNAYLQFKAKKPKRSMTVKRIQWVLNERLGTNLVCDGIAGQATRDAYKRWEKRCGAPGANGVPGKFSLGKLGNERFKVSWVSYEKWIDSKVNKDEQRAAEEKNPTFK